MSTVRQVAGVSGTGQASRTAVFTAVARGHHLMTHGPRAVCADTLAWALAGPDAEPALARLGTAFGALMEPFFTGFAFRARVTEDWLDAAGHADYVILGAGLDSFAWRRAGPVRVIEVDHPATQAWKLARLAALGLALPPDLTLVAVDFERESVADGLHRAGLAGQAFVSWLGVTPYLSTDAIAATLRALPPCTLAVSYLMADEIAHGDDRRIIEIVTAIVTAVGEPLTGGFTPDSFAALMADCGFEVLEDLGPEDARTRHGLPCVGGERYCLARRASR